MKAAAVVFMLAALVTGSHAFHWTTLVVDFDTCDSVADVAAAGNFTILLAAVEAAGLTEAVSDKELVATVFAPTDEAFMEAIDALDTTAEDLLANTDLLTAVLTTHIVEGVLGLSTWELAPMNSNQTLTIAPTVSTGVNTAQITTPGVRTCRGIVYPIDTVLLPQA